MPWTRSPTIPSRPLLLACLVLLFHGHVSPLPAQCASFDGEVIESEEFERGFADGLRFRLRPVTAGEGGGWAIEVLGVLGEHDLAWVATPPYRFANPLDITPSYGRTAAEAVAWDRRAFGYATGENAYAELEDVVTDLLWGDPERTEAGSDSLHARWRALIDRAGTGELRITDAAVLGPAVGRPLGRIVRIAFAVSLCGPGNGEGRAGE